MNLNEPKIIGSLVEYQKDAVRKAEEAIVNKQRKILLAMATGTGKTRTVIALMYRLLKAGYFKRILFLVDSGARVLFVDFKDSVP